MEPHGVVIGQEFQSRVSFFWQDFLKQVVTEIQKMERPRQKFSKYPPPNVHLLIHAQILRYNPAFFLLTAIISSKLS